jgi:hypothetical protein
MAREMKMLGGRDNNIIDPFRSEQFENVGKVPKTQSASESESQHFILMQ